jgi:hypothetical protein
MKTVFKNARCLEKKKTKNMFGYHFVEPIEFDCEWECNCHPFLGEPSMNITFPS